MPWGVDAYVVVAEQTPDWNSQATTHCRASLSASCALESRQALTGAVESVVLARNVAEGSCPDTSVGLYWEQIEAVHPSYAHRLEPELHMVRVDLWNS